MVTPADAARRARGHHRLEGVDVAHLVAEDGDASRSLAGDQPLDRLTLAAGVARAKIDDRPTAVVREPVHEAQASFHAVDRIDDRGARRGDVVGLANVEGHGWSLTFDEQPRRRPKLGCDGGRERAGRSAVRIEGRIGRDDQALGAPAPWQPAVLEAVVTEVFDAADADARGHIRDDAPGQHREGEPVRPLGRDAAEPPECPLRERLDAGDGRVARPDGEGAVEVDHEQQRCGNGQGGERRVDRGRGRDRGQRRRDRVLRRRGAGRCHGRPVTAGMTSRLASSMVPRSSSGRLGAGAGSSTWRAAAGAPEPPTAEGDADAEGEALGLGVAEPLGPADALGLGVAEVLGLALVDALGDGSSAKEAGGRGAAFGAAPGTGAKRRIPPRTSAAAAIPVTRPATIDSRGHMLARRVPVRTRRGASAEPPIRCASDGQTDR